MPVPADGQVLLRTLWLSLDPYMRGRMNEGPSYAPAVELGEVMVGGTVSRVEVSRHPDFIGGDLALGFSGWQSWAVAEGSTLARLDPAMTHMSLALGVLGMPGFTAYIGLLDIGQPKAGETVVVAAASGAVGSVVGQIARLKGCRAVGIAGSAEKCRVAVAESGFESCIDRTADDFAARLAAACPDGIDVYFESVGGAVFDAVLPLLNINARVPLCGLIANYNDSGVAPGPDRLPLLARTVLSRRLKIQGFIISDAYGARYGAFMRDMRGWVDSGQVKFREDIVVGLDEAPRAFIGLLEGRNLGKLVIEVGNETSAATAPGIAPANRPT